MATTDPAPSATDDAEVEKLRAAYRSRFGTDAITEIHPADEMFNLLRINAGGSPSAGLKKYLETGEALVNELAEIYRDIGYSFDRVGSFLDFACGFGRVTRFLANRLGPQRVTSSDICRDGVDFVRRTFGVKGFYSAGEPSEFEHDGTHDAIHVVSLFSHLPLRTWADFLSRLYGMLNPGGILVFSTVGDGAYKICRENGTWPEFEPQAPGFAYFVGNETMGRLDGHIYGTSYVTESFVRQVIDDRRLGRLVRFLPQGIGGFQDGFVIEKAS
jgi:SAM-dependent methyltransferase